MMWISLSAVILLSVLSVQCLILPDSLFMFCKSGALLYEEIGCTPIKSNGDCASSFNCSNYRLPKHGCLFEKHVYKYGEAIKGTNPCYNCTCIGNAKNGSKIECYNVEYEGPIGPIFPGYGPPSDCYYTYELNNCISSQLKCPPYKNMSICVVDSKGYIEGEKFQPSGKCLDCVCQKGYNGKFVEPFCRKKRCDVEIQYSKQIVDNCAPLYNNNIYPICCPYDFICPSNSKIEHLVKQNSTDHVEKCKFGTQTFNKFDRLDLVYGNNITANCVCSLPPLLTCRN